MTFEFKYEPSTPEPSPTENLIVSFTGSRFNKTKRALVDLGPAIANAGMTTFLAVIILPASSSHVFLTFFKVTSMTVLFGLFHGLCFLPNMFLLLGNDQTDDDYGMSKPSKDDEPVTKSPKKETDNPVFISTE